MDESSRVRNQPFLRLLPFSHDRGSPADNRSRLSVRIVYRGQFPWNLYIFGVGDRKDAKKGERERERERGRPRYENDSRKRRFTHDLIPR